MRPGRPARPLSRPLLLTTAAMGGVLAPLNSTMLAVALPELRGDFAVGHGTLAWLVSSYLIAMAVAQPLGGRLGDQLGRPRVFRWGLAAFLCFSLAAALSPSLPLLVLLRAGQALAGAVVIPNGIAMLRASLPPDRLGRSVGLVGAAMALAAALGPVVGAALLATGSWRPLFLINVPLVLIALACVRALRYQERRERARFTLDVTGALAFGALLAAATLVLGALGGGGHRIAALVAAGSLTVLVPLFVRSQRASNVPVVEWGLFCRRSFAGATSYVLFSNLVMYTALVSIPFFVEEVQGKGSGTSGALLGTMSVAVALASPVGGRLSDRLGRRAPAVAGSLVVVVATGVLVAGMTREVSPVFLVAALGMLGLGLGMGSGPATAAAAESVPSDAAGSAAGVNSMMRYIGGIAGVGVLSAVLGGAGRTPDVALFRAVFTALIVASLLAAASTLFIRGRLPSAPAAEGSPRPGLQASPLSTTGGHR